MKTKTSLEQRTVEPIVLGNLALDGEAVRGDDGKYLIKNQQKWMNYLPNLGARLPTLPEYFAFIHHLQKENHSASEGLLQDLRNSVLCIGTQFGYHNNNNVITHFGDGNPFVIPCIIPKESGYLDDLVGIGISKTGDERVDAWRKVLHSALQYANVDEAVEVLQEFSGKRLYIWTPSVKERKSDPERAVWLGGYADRFGLDCGGDPIGGGGRARRVRRLEGCEAPCVENGSPYRTSAISEEERLEEGIREALFPLNKYVGTFGQEPFNQEREQAVKKILKLCSKR